MYPLYNTNVSSSLNVNIDKPFIILVKFIKLSCIKFLYIYIIDFFVFFLTFKKKSFIGNVKFVKLMKMDSIAVCSRQSKFVSEAFCYLITYDISSCRCIEGSER